MSGTHEPIGRHDDAVESTVCSWHSTAAAVGRAILRASVRRSARASGQKRCGGRSWATWSSREPDAVRQTCRETVGQPRGHHDDLRPLCRWRQAPTSWPSTPSRRYTAGPPVLTAVGQLDDIYEFAGEEITPRSPRTCRRGRSRSRRLAADRRAALNSVAGVGLAITAIAADGRSGISMSNTRACSTVRLRSAAPHRAVQPVLEVDHALATSRRAGTDLRRTWNPPTAGGPAASTVVVVTSSSRRIWRGGICDQSSIDSPWSGYGLPSRTPLKITCPRSFDVDHRMATAPP